MNVLCVAGREESKDDEVITVQGVVCPGCAQGAGTTHSPSASQNHDQFGSIVDFVDFLATLSLSCVRAVLASVVEISWSAAYLATLPSFYIAHSSTLPTVLHCPQFYIAHSSTLPTVLHCPQFYIAHSSTLPTVLHCPQFYIAHSSTLPTVLHCPQFYIAHSSTLPTVLHCPQFYIAHSSTLPTVLHCPQFYIAHSSTLPTVLHCPQFYIAHSSTLPTVLPNLFFSVVFLFTRGVLSDCSQGCLVVFLPSMCLMWPVHLGARTKPPPDKTPMDKTPSDKTPLDKTPSIHNSIST